MEQFPIGAIDHIGLPESTLPKEVCNNLSMLHIFHATPSCCIYCDAQPVFHACLCCELQVVQILPSDYYAQLELAHHISCYAFSSKVGA